jgi:uncharacterized membrane protein YgdD (TMEM256/DUF423 family)
MHRHFLTLAALSAFLAVGFGAFGAHGLKHLLTDTQMAVYKTAVEYHFWHALGLGLVGLLAERHPASGPLRWSGWLMFGGIVVFSGSLYALCLTGTTWLGMMTPFGGTAFLAAWLCFAVAAWRLE